MHPDRDSSDGRTGPPPAPQPQYGAGPHPQYSPPGPPGAYGAYGPSGSYSPPAPYPPPAPQTPQGYPGQAGPYGYGPSGYGAPPAPPRASRLQVTPGTALVALGGLLYFIGSFLPFLAFDLRDICTAFPSDLPFECESEIPDETLTAGGWSSTFIAISAVLMLALAVLMVIRMLGVLKPSAVIDHAIAGVVGLAALLTVIVIGLLDATGLTTALALDFVDEFAEEFGTVVGDIPFPGLGLGAWMCLAGLALTLVGLVVGRVQARTAATPAASAEDHVGTQPSPAQQDPHR